MELHTAATDIARARAAVAAVTDPEMPMMTLEDLGVLRGVEQTPRGTIIVTLTPTYSGCPAMATIRSDVQQALVGAGFTEIEVRTDLAPPWSSDWITESGRSKLAAHGIAPPGPVSEMNRDPVTLTLQPYARTVPCPQCGSADTTSVSEFGATACKALQRCRSCGETFDRFKEV